MSIKFNANEIRYIALFESMTGAMVKDCIIDDELSKVTFVVKNGDMGLAIGKGGSTVTKVKRAVDKGVEIIEIMKILLSLLETFSLLPNLNPSRLFKRKVRTRLQL